MDTVNALAAFLLLLLQCCNAARVTDPVTTLHARVPASGNAATVDMKGASGLLFDLEASQDLQIMSVDIGHWTVPASCEIWVANKHGGRYETLLAPEHFTLVANTSSFQGPAREAHRILLSKPIFVSAGQLRTVYIFGLPGKLAAGTQEGLTANDDVLSIHSGDCGKPDKWQSWGVDNYEFAGSMQYYVRTTATSPVEAEFPAGPYTLPARVPPTGDAEDSDRKGASGLIFEIEAKRSLKVTELVVGHASVPASLEVWVAIGSGHLKDIPFTEESFDLVAKVRDYEGPVRWNHSISLSKPISMLAGERRVMYLFAMPGKLVAGTRSGIVSEDAALRVHSGDCGKPHKWQRYGVTNYEFAGMLRYVEQDIEDTRTGTGTSTGTVMGMDCNSFVKGALRRTDYDKAGKQVCKCAVGQFLAGASHCRADDKVRKFDPSIFRGCKCAPPGLSQGGAKCHTSVTGSLQRNDHRKAAAKVCKCREGFYLGGATIRCMPEKRIRKFDPQRFEGCRCVVGPSVSRNDFADFCALNARGAIPFDSDQQLCQCSKGLELAGTARGCQAGLTTFDPSDFDGSCSCKLPSGTFKRSLLVELDGSVVY